MKDFQKFNPLFSVLNDQLFVSCFDDKNKSSYAIAQEKWEEYIRYGNLSIDPLRKVTYDKFVIAAVDDDGKAEIYARSFNDCKYIPRKDNKPER